MRKLLVLAGILAGVLAARGQVWEEWVARYNGPANYTDELRSLAVDQNGNVYVTGWITGIGSSSDFATIKYNSLGILRWVVYYNGPANSFDAANKIAVDSDGNVYVTGASMAIGTNSDYTTIKYDSEGVQQWIARYSGPYNQFDEAYDLLLDQDSNVYITGGSYESGNYDYLTIKYNTSGVQQWLAFYNSQQQSTDVAYSLAADQNNNIYVTGKSGNDYATIMYNPHGTQQWLARYDGPGNEIDCAYKIKVDQNSNSYVTGWSRGNGTNYDYATVKYSSDGHQLWVARYNGPANHYDVAHDIAVDNNGNVYITGYSYATMSNYDYLTIKYDSEGEQIWANRYDCPGSGNDEAWALTLDDYNNVYVTGRSAGVFWDFLTIKYDSMGVEKWEISYNGLANSNDEARCIANDQNGNIYVAGKSIGSGADYDYLVIKYTQNCPLSIDLMPISPPIQLPDSGGSFSFDATLSNQSASPQNLDTWIMMQLPDLTWSGPALGPVNLTLSGNSSLTRLRTQDIPASAPAGEYIYRGYVGDYPSIKWDSSSFNFTKLSTGAGPMISDWSNTGEPFPGEPSQAASIPSGPELSIGPNPFNSSTAISYQLQATSPVKLTVWNIAGRLIITLVDEIQAASEHSVTFDGSNLPSGVYLVHLQAGDYTAAQKVVLLK